MPSYVRHLGPGLFNHYQIEATGDVQLPDFGAMRAGSNLGMIKAVGVAVGIYDHEDNLLLSLSAGDHTIIHLEEDGTWRFDQEVGLSWNSNAANFGPLPVSNTTGSSSCAEVYRFSDCEGVEADLYSTDESLEARIGQVLESDGVCYSVSKISLEAGQSVQLSDSPAGDWADSCEVCTAVCERVDIFGDSPEYSITGDWCVGGSCGGGSYNGCGLARRLTPDGTTEVGTFTVSGLKANQLYNINSNGRTAYSGSAPQNRLTIELGTMTLVVDQTSGPWSTQFGTGSITADSAGEVSGTITHENDNSANCNDQCYWRELFFTCA